MLNRHNLYTCTKSPLSIYIIYTIKGNGAGEKKRDFAIAKPLYRNQNPKSNSENLSDNYMIALFFRFVKPFFLISSEPEQEQQNTLVNHHTSRAGAAHISCSLQEQFVFIHGTSTSYNSIITFGCSAYAFEITNSATCESS